MAGRPRWSRYQLALEIRSFLDEFDMKPTPFGIAAAQDDKLLWRIENAPYGISLDKADRIRSFMAQYRADHFGRRHDHQPNQRDKVSSA